MALQPIYINPKTNRLCNGMGEEIQFNHIKGLCPDGVVEIADAVNPTTTQTTVGAAGGATALPATPTGYIQVKLNGGAALRVIPFYAVS